MTVRIISLFILYLTTFSQLLSFPTIKDSFSIDSQSIKVLKQHFPDSFNPKFKGPYKLYLLADNDQIKVAIKNEVSKVFHIYNPDFDNQIETIIHPNIDNLAFPIGGHHFDYLASFLTNEDEKLALVEKDGQFSIVPFTVIQKQLKKNRWASFLSQYISSTFPDIFQLHKKKACSRN